MADHLSEQQAFDPAVALATVSGDREFLLEVATVFVGECPKLLGAAQQALTAGDPVALQRSAHTIKGGARNFGAAPVMQAARKLEELSRDKLLPDCHAVLLTLRKELNALCPALMEFAQQR